MQWLSNLPFADDRVVQIGFLAACGIAALVVLAILYRFVFAHRLRVPGARTRQPRLGLVDAFSLDGQRQLVLVRRDNVEHLIMIGGPNDVLVESQINRALAAARENNVAPAAQAPPAPQRRTEPVVALPVPAAAKASPQTPQPAPSPPQPAPAAPQASPVAAEVRPIRPQAVSSSPPPSPREASPPAAVPAPVAPEPVAQPAPPPAAAKALEPARPVQSQPQPRPLPARPAMPPPITPSGDRVARANVTRLSEKHHHAASSGLLVPAAAQAPAPAATGANPGRVESSGPHPTQPQPTPALQPAAAMPPAPPIAIVKAGTHAPAEAPMTATAELKIGRAPTQGAAPAPAADRRPAAVPAAEQPSVDKTAPKPVDPFGGLESLEAEMARLLGREKLP